VSRERPKETPKPAPGESSSFKNILDFLFNRQAGHKQLTFDRRSAPADPRKIFEQKREGKRGGWHKWETDKIWAPMFKPDGSIFVPESKDSRQQKRKRERDEAYKYMAEKFGGEPRRIRRSMARAKLKNFRLAERALSGKLESGVSK
jgi:hypothetical protein